MSRCVWYISKYVAPPVGKGVGGRAYMILRELARRGDDVVLITSDSNQLTPVPKLDAPFLLEEADGMKVLWLRTFKYTLAKSLRRMLSWVDFEYRLLFAPLKKLPSPDVVVVSSLSLLTVLNGIRLKWKYGSRLVFEVRDIWPLTIVEEGGFGSRNPFVIALGMIERIGYWGADAIVGTMPNLGEHVKNVLGRSKPVHCIPMGFDEVAYAHVAPLPAGYAERHFPAGKFIVAHVGTIGITNALDTFIECARAMKDDDAVHFVMVGDGDLRAQYVKECEDLPNIGFAPKVSKESVQSVLSLCDLVYFSTFNSEVWRYGQSLNKIIDYMYSGTPIVASYSGYPSMINEADCGSFVPAGDVRALAAEIRRYAAMDRETREQIGARGREWLMRYRTFDRLALDYERVLFPNVSEAAS
jgi:glycosyltransferase involved in cell wall biosynthesis